MELFGSTSHRGFSVRSIFTSVLVVVVTALLWVLFGSITPVNAQTPTDASWSGETIIHGGHQYTKADPAKLDQSHGIAKDSTIYTYREATGASSSSRKAFIIYFAPGVDPPTATSAQYVEYDYSSSGTFSDPQNKKTITIAPPGEQAALSSCSVDGIGWLICPVSVFLANAMDWLFSILAGLIAVQPSTLGDANNDLFRAWSVMRNIANVAFVIAFMIIIYSQLTSIGLSNYGLKKLIPRLIIAAILVNMSFIVTALAIDISNVLGYSIQEVLNNIREDVFVMTNETNGGPADNWGALTAIVLGGGALGYAAIGSAGGAIYLLVPLLVGLGATLLFVVLVLAARQAIIIILVVVAPLAFVAYLLPNTEKWFDKWRDLFMTMLIFFPAFSLVFGGSQLAGQIVIQNAGDNIVMLIFGMAVQVAPLVITPLLLKLSGGVLGKIAQIANDPRKGYMDKSRNWADARIDRKRQQNLDPTKRPTSWKNPFSYGRKALQAIDNNNRVVKEETDLAKLGSDNRYQQIPRAKRIHEAMAGAELHKEQIHNDQNTHVEREKVRFGSSLYDRALQAEASKENLETGKNTTAAHFNRERQNSLSPLNASTIGLEASKSRLETSDNDKNVYLARQRMMAGTVLNRTVAGLESSKLRLESTQNQYTSMVETMKLDPTSSMYNIAQGAQSSKELLEAAQNAVQAHFDDRRTIAGTGLNLSAIELERSKVIAEGLKAKVTTYISDLKVERGLSGPRTDLHVQVLRTEEAKHAQQVSESKLTRFIEEYKSGKVDPTILTTEETAIMRRMVVSTEELSAEKQGINSAQGEQQGHVTEVMASGSARADELLTTAGSVDEDGKQRALATALAQQARGRKETLDNAKAIISFKKLNTEAIRQLAEGIPVAGIDMSQDIIAAAIQMTFGGKDTKQIVAGLKNIDLSFPGATPEKRSELQTLASEALAENAARPPFVTAGFLAMMKAGNQYDNTPFTGAYGDAGLEAMVITAANAEKLDSSKFQTAGRDYASAILDAVTNNPGSLNAAAKNRLVSELARTLDPERDASQGLGDSMKVLQDIQDNVVIREINNNSVDATKLRTSKDYANGILWSIRRAGPGAVTPVAKAQLMRDVTDLLSAGSPYSGTLGDIKPILESIEKEL